MIQRGVIYAKGMINSTNKVQCECSTYLKIGLNGDVGRAVGDQEPHVLVLD